ncbi:ABC transporter substrate-binding protein [Streptomyces armeniacus]|uniref:ABC transporter substrate-binding protein n=1 Tax=Streptomyces armeniacus TaxID=83291 RepID=A0A345XLG5_9ACTN|nr:ABC transporter substrate-binding protein [Streptomyces armeniacus]AXK32481.1 ABC transporter substrate-binding protein [Streptomyces armeniacus]
MHRNRISRPALAVAGVLVAGSAAACGGGGTEASSKGEDGPVRVMMFAAQSYRLPVMMAEQEGFFEKRGIEIDITEQPANLQGMQGLDATKSDVGQVTVGTLGQGWQAGSKGAFFCGGIDVLQTTLMAPKGSELPSAEEGATWQQVLKSLKGKKVGIQTPVGSGLQKIFAAALEEAGVEDVTYVNLGGGSSAAIAALGKGSVDVAQVNPTGTQHILNAKSGKPLLYMPDGPKAYKDYYGSGWVAPTRFLEERPEKAKAFCAAVEEALAFIKAPENRKSSVAMLEKDTGVDKPVAELVLDQAYGDYSTKLDKGRLDATFDSYVELGILKGSPKPTFDTLVKPQG